MGTGGRRTLWGQGGDPDGDPNRDQEEENPMGGGRPQMRPK